jgi:hypothetical protein
LIGMLPIAHLTSFLTAGSLDFEYMRRTAQDVASASSYVRGSLRMATEATILDP